MRIAKKLLVLVLLMRSFGLCAQFTLSGHVVDSAQHPIEFVTISLIKDTTVVQTALSDHGGKYQFTMIPAATYKLVFSHLNYFSSDTVLRITENSQVNQVLTINANHLTQVQVTGRKQLIERKADRFIVNVAQRIAGASNAWEVLGKSPLITVKEPGLILLSGGGGTLQLNGRNLRMPPDALAAYLKGIPAGSVDKIEILTTPSSEFDADTKGGIINIILKKPVTDGWLGGVQFSTTQLTYNNQSLTASAEYQKKKLTVYGFTNVTNSHFLSWQKIHSDYSFKQPNPNVSNQQVNVDRDSKEKGVTGNLGMDYKFNRHHQLGFVVDYSLRDMDRDNIAPTRFLSPAMNTTDSIHVSRGGNTELAKYVNADLLYKIRLDSAGQSLKLQTSGYWFKEDRNGALNTTFKQQEGTAEIFRNLFKNGLPLSIWNYTANADYTYPWNRGKFQLDMGTKYSQTQSSGDIAFDHWNGSGFIHDIHESQSFLYKEQIYAVYSSLTHKIGPTLNYKLGLRLEQTRTLNESDDTRTKNRYTNLFPNAFLFYSLHPSHQLSYAFIGQLQRPSFFDVNPFKLYSTDRIYLTGDPFLRPSRRYRHELTYTLQNKHIFQLIYSQTYNRISAQTIVDNDGKLHTQKGNYSDFNAVTVVSSLNPQFFPWLSTSFNLYAGLIHYKGSVVNFPINQRTAFATASINSSATIKSLWNLIVGADISENAPFYSDNTYVKNQFVVNGFVSKRLGQTWRFTGSVNDIFHTAFDRYRTVYEQTQISERNYYEMNSGVRLTIAYNFQHKERNSGINKSAGNNEEKRRIGK
ncbi:outer membrane beta-barrel protein [Paraflavitalea sp. CAU 1676]|uniref:outer membrane beta-barrel protein n=1 Tax=Paraflavitalea sp. CAU 1676 TaxID=3032598 RepID=UPI0023DA1B9C|nr:outer membrane beta-barrel protein [Paraflavitalea sp. CAU 1676]MDF2192590.1 outer membrane beta-barrel protein [Paraflavitalea sp. CAU 1676]